MRTMRMFRARWRRTCVSTVLVAAGAPVASVVADARVCGVERAPILVAALLKAAEELESRDARWRRRGCLVVSQGPLPADPPKAVLFALRKRLRTRIVPISEASKCDDGPEIWVGEPYCGGHDWANVERWNEHCGYTVRRDRGRWTAHLPMVCE